ncbi:GNAT family N-acetyltransferase [Amorphus orientalis]|uniref:Acetyltransferase n=1 Tax=Amorphus orientalis TaxID=649198 RepID=A0AAE3VP79_9HYPH|nr:GNAT family N-acetyltransferase [Amorphus orientalis]MDQ0315261.1 putative acetyltransferase [Amorphus orientalis]
MSVTFHLRPALDGDGPALGGIIATIFADYPGCYFVEEELPELAAPASHFAGLGGSLWVVEAGGQVVGSLAVAPTRDPQVHELFKVYLARSARGRGLARQLLARAEATARERGARRLRLWTDTRFVEAHRFYERNGFERLPVRRALADASDTWEFAYTRPIVTSDPDEEQ